MSLFEELKRRNVFRVAVAYLVTSWLILQVADLVLENIDAPGWVMQVLMLALVLGLPLALVFAWAFELTPEGLKKEKDVDRSRSITKTTGRKLDRAIVLVLAVTVVVLVIDRVRHAAHDEVAAVQQTATEAAGLAPSIAVLPFVNMSSDPEQEYFSDGISEEILNSLAKVKELKVAGRTSSFAFKGQNQDLRTIGDALGVEHILEGSVRKAGAQVRITAQLIQVDDGFHLWSETYDRELDDVFAIQDEIAGAILEQLKTHLVGLEPSAAVVESRVTDSEVYDLYLLARQRIYERKQPSLELAVELLDRAIALDPAYAPAWAQRGIATLLLSESNYGTLTRREAWSQGRRFVDEALRLDPELAEAWAGLGLYHNNRPGEDRLAIEPLEKALAINPSLMDASNWLQISYGAIGELRRSLEILEDMVERDPLFPPGFSNTILAYNSFGLQEKSWALLERVRPFLPGDPQLMQVEANIWVSLGRPSKALPLLDEALAAQPNDFVIRSNWGIALLQTGQYERIVNEDGLEWTRAIALTALGRNEEANGVAAGLASDGIPGPLIGHLYRTRQWEKLVGFVESRWIDLSALETEFPDNGDGYGLMLNVAGAYAYEDNSARFGDAMARVRAAHDRGLQQNEKDNGLLRDEARYHALLGDSDQAIGFIERAIDQNLMVSEPLHAIWQEFEALRGDPRYEAAMARMQERVDAERAELGLEPISS